MLGQLVVLGVFAVGYPLARHFPRPVDDLADIAVAVTQLFLAILLGPELLPDVPAAVRAWAGGAVIHVAAAGLADRSADGVVPVLIWSALWLVALAGHTPRSLRSGMAIVLLGGCGWAYAAGHVANLPLLPHRFAYAQILQPGTSTLLHFGAVITIFGPPIVTILCKTLWGKHLEPTPRCDVPA